MQKKEIFSILDDRTLNYYHLLLNTDRKTLNLNSCEKIQLQKLEKNLELLNSSINQIVVNFKYLEENWDKIFLSGQSLPYLKLSPKSAPVIQEIFSKLDVLLKLELENILEVDLKEKLVEISSSYSTISEKNQRVISSMELKLKKLHDLLAEIQKILQIINLKKDEPKLPLETLDESVASGFSIGNFVSSSPRTPRL